MSRIVVKIADYKIATGSIFLVTYGLGSCVAVALYDPEIRTAGMGHIMLPDSAGVRTPGKSSKFADLCISEMLRELEDNKCEFRRLVAKIAGGASMFDIPDKEKLRIGERNRDAVMSELAKRGIPLTAEDTGGNYGRTVEFNTGTGDMVVRSMRNGTKVI